MEFINRELTKWPRLLVAGASVTEDQASEILVRTDSWFLSSNSHDWERTVYAAAGIEITEHGWPAEDSLREFCARMGVLRLSYLTNSQIVSAWVGGAHGWCHWDGRIGCANYNLGKWPTTEEITDDWIAIAAAFPYLDLTAQLVTNEGAGRLVGEWRLQDGEVHYEPFPPEQIRPLDDSLLTSAGIARLMRVDLEPGVTLGRLEEALQLVRGISSGGR